jgi:hypothetical protein
MSQASDNSFTLFYHMEAAYIIVSTRLVETAATASYALDVLVQKDAAFKQDPSSAEAAAAFQRADLAYTAAAEAMQKAAELKQAVVEARIKACND